MHLRCLHCSAPWHVGAWGRFLSCELGISQQLQKQPCRPSVSQSLFVHLLEEGESCCFPAPLAGCLGPMLCFLESHSRASPAEVAVTLGMDIASLRMIMSLLSMCLFFFLDRLLDFLTQGRVGDKTDRLLKQHIVWVLQTESGRLWILFFLTSSIRGWKVLCICRGHSVCGLVTSPFSFLIRYLTPCSRSLIKMGQGQNRVLSQFLLDLPSCLKAPGCSPDFFPHQF